jgi:hypothetical protein
VDPILWGNRNRIPSGKIMSLQQSIAMNEFEQELNSVNRAGSTNLPGVPWLLQLNW